MTSANRTAYDALYGACAWIPLPEGTYVRLVGQDAKGWLQGQVSQDLRDLAPGDAAEACLLKPTGQIEAVLTIFVLADGAMVATTSPAPVRERVKRFVIMEDVALDPAPRESASLQGPESTERLAALFGSTASNALRGAVGSIEVEAYRSPRTAPGGWDLVFPVGAGDTVREALGGPVVGDADLLHLAMLELGSPVAGVDIGTKTLPPELGPQFEDRTVSYRKGCYSGQEVMARIKSRGHTNVTWARVTADEPLEACTTLIAPDGTEAGSVTRFSVSPRQGTIGAAWLRNRWAEPGTVLRGEGKPVTVTAWPGPA